MWKKDDTALLRKQGELIWSGDLMDFNLTPGIWGPSRTHTFLSLSVYKELEKQQQFRERFCFRMETSNQEVTWSIIMQQEVTDL